MTIHVDDIRGSSPTPEDAGLVTTDIKSLFDITVNLPTDTFLGVETVMLPNGDIKLHQQAYVQRMLRRFGMENCTTVSSPMTKDYLIPCPDPPATTRDQKAQVTLYRAIVGSLNYLAMWTRPDIMFAVSQLAKYNQHPGTVHHTAAKRVFRYLQGTINQGIIYQAGITTTSLASTPDCPARPFIVGPPKSLRGGNNKVAKRDPMSLTATTEIFVDSDYANQPGRKSVTGIYICINGRAIHWFSKQQSVVAGSSTEAEYIAINQATKEALWLRKLQRDLHDPPCGPTKLYEDNQGCIRLTVNPESFSRTKHIDVRYHMVRDYVEKGEVEAI